MNKSDNGIRVRRVTDVSLLIAWRMEVLEHVFGADMPEDTGALADANLQYYINALKDGTHVAVMADINGVDVGCAAYCLQHEMPSPDNASALCAYIMNVYVRAAYRNHGVATAMLNTLIGEAQKAGCGKIYLETTEQAMPLYSHLGFEPLTDMLKLQKNGRKNVHTPLRPTND